MSGIYIYIYICIYDGYKMKYFPGDVVLSVGRLFGLVRVVTFYSTYLLFTRLTLWLLYPLLPLPPLPLVYCLFEKCVSFGLPVGQDTVFFSFFLVRGLVKRLVGWLVLLVI